MSRTAGRTHVTYSCSGMERLVPSSWSSPAPEIFVHFSPGAARHSRSAGGRHGFTAAQANGSHPELYKLHCSKLSRGGRLAGRPRSWRQTNASVDERHCRQSSHCQIARATTPVTAFPGDWPGWRYRPGPTSRFCTAVNALPYTRRPSLRIPVKSTSDSGSSRPPVLIQVDRRFRFHPASAVALRGWSEVAMAGQC